MNTLQAPRNSIPILLGYSVLVVALLGFYLGGAVAEGLKPIDPSFAEYAEAFVFGVILIAGAFAVNFGAPAGWVLSVGTWGSFVALTANQSEPLVRYLTLGAVLFAIGVYGMIVSRNAVRVLMSIELMLNAVNINLVAFARYVDPVAVKGQVFAIFILTVAAAEAAVGLAIVLAIYRNLATVDMERFNILKW